MPAAAARIRHMPITGHLEAVTARQYMGMFCAMKNADAEHIRLAPNRQGGCALGIFAPITVCHRVERRRHRDVAAGVTPAGLNLWSTFQRASAPQNPASRR